MSKDEQLIDIKDIEEIKTNVNFVVGIGASAGGLEALEQFFRNVPPDSGMAFVVIQHLSPDYKSLMVELLSKHTKMKVVRVEDGMVVEPNTVYLIPPKKNMTIFHGKLFLTNQNYKMGLNLPIDIFFRSLADDMAEKAIAIILSGTGSDGTLGVRAIKGAGGMVMVQDESAKFDGMPKSAIATGLVDYILPPEKMGERLIQYAKHPFIAKADDIKKETLDEEDTYTKVLAVLRNKVGVDFTFYKPTTIIRRIERRISVNQLDNIENYLNLLMESPTEVSVLYKELLIGVTKFFRDTEAYKVVEEKLIPELFASKTQGEQIRIWDVACSSGEEAYSIAILLKEYLEKYNLNFDVKIFATDIDRDSIEYASAGIYPESIVTDVPEDKLKKYFRKKGDSYRINENIRQMVIFATHNIIKDPPFSKLDLIVCRNLLIYFQPIMQKKVISAFSFALNPGGFLFLGSSESVGELANFFTIFDNRAKIYRSKEGIKVPMLNELYMPVIRKHRGFVTPESIILKPNSAEEILEDITKKLFQDFMPPAVIVDEKLELIHVFNDVNKFMKVPTGKINLNIMNMINPDLSIALGTAIHRALKEAKDILYKDLILKSEDNQIMLDLDVRPYIHKRTGTKYVVVIFYEKDFAYKSSENIEVFEMTDKVNQRIFDLEQELKYTKENLQATIEELETSNEELQATNEELIASNEELQSTNEELQSVNEELYTVNAEYQSKIEELTELNNDISNWFNITNIGTIFLDLQLRIRKFTPAITQFINLIDHDLGRPIKHISYNFDYPKFMDDIDFVLKTLRHIETEVKTYDHNWFLVKILPYRTIENAVKGVVITFIDITRQKNIEKQLELERDLLLRVLDSSPLAKVIVDNNGIITYMNKAAEEILGLKKDKVIGIVYNSDIFNQQDLEGNILPIDKMPYRIVFDTKKTLKDYKISIQTGNNPRKVISVSGEPIYNENNDVTGAVFNFVEIK
jgi:two-component system CheB/CheR fusion protein